MSVLDHQRLDYYRLPPKEVLAELETSNHGLAPDDAHERLEHQGRNELNTYKKSSALRIFMRQFKSALVTLLLVSAGVSLYLGDHETSVVLILIAAINACIGMFQEYKAESLMESLHKLVVPKAKVMRGGVIEEIIAAELVVGDIVFIEEGDSVPADLRILEEEELATNDFALTGESNPSRKFVHAITDDVQLGDRHNLVFMGTTVAIGQGRGVVIGTGMHTELGRIASLSQETASDSSPLQKEMAHLSKRIIQGVIFLAAILTVIAVQADFAIKAALLFGIGIATAMIPSGLVAEVNFSLAQAASRMAKKRTLVKRLAAVETLGATNIIATDKTGTLTKNEMTVEEMIIGRDVYYTTATGYEPGGAVVDSNRQNLSPEALQKLELFFETAALASNARINPPDEEHNAWYCIGDPTEGALVALVRKAGFEPDDFNNKYQEIKEFQFDSARKLMSSTRRVDGQIIAFTKGAPESVIARATKLWDHGHVRNFTKADREFYLDQANKLAASAKRNLAFGYRVLPKGSNPKRMAFEEVEKDFVFLGMVSMVDPIRDDVPVAMEAARGAHIKVSIITGDHPITAKAIAKKAKLAASAKDITIVLGQDLQKLSDTQIMQMLNRGGAVFSRVTPEDKLRIVELAKHQGRVVAVTGDGINDAPALKRADIGVAMGRTGTDVAKEAAEIVLLDDSFNTLVTAVQQGRLTYQNIRKSARCAMTDNAGELMLIFASIIAGALFDVPTAITAIQILALDVIAQIGPLSALAWDPPQGELMTEKPRNLKDHIINRSAVIEFAGYGLLAAILAYGNFLLFFARNHISPVHLSDTAPIYLQATVLTWVTVVLCQFMNLMLVRANKDEYFFTSYLWSNKKLLYAFAFSFFCILNITYNPLLQPYFGSAGLSWGDWFFAVLAAIVYTAIRLIHRHSRKHTRKTIAHKHQTHHHLTGHNLLRQS